jgi:broad specificity phosphatase PhoE
MVFLLRFLSSMTQSQPLPLSQSPVVDVDHFHSLLPPLLDNDTSISQCRRVYLIRHGETDWNVLYKIQGGGYDMPLNANGIRQANAVANLFVAKDEEGSKDRTTTTTTTTNNSVGGPNDSVLLSTEQPPSRMIVPVDLVASSHLERAHATADVVWKACCEANRRPEEDEVHLPTLPSSSTTSLSTNTAATATPIPRVVYPGLSEMRFGCLEGLSRDKNYIPPTNDDDIDERQSHESLLELYKQVSVQMRTDLTLPWPGEGGESQVDVQTRSLAAFYDILDAYPDKRHIVMVSHGRTNRVLLASLLCRLKEERNEDDKEDATVNENNNKNEGRRRTPQQLDPTDFLQTQRDIKQGSKYLVNKSTFLHVPAVRFLVSLCMF